MWLTETSICFNDYESYRKKLNFHIVIRHTRVRLHNDDSTSYNVITAVINYNYRCTEGRRTMEYESELKSTGHDNTADINYIHINNRKSEV